jgi:branched-chain amino acid transport system substrate-binding protein
MRMGFTFIAALLGSVAVAVGGTDALAQGKPTIKIGTILPMSGPIASVGKPFQMGILLAVEDVNAQGEINGSKLELVTEDDQLNPAQSVLVIRKLASSNVVAVMGPVSGTSWENVAPLMPALKLPTINITSLKPQVANNEWTMRVEPHDGTMIPEALAEFKKAYPNVKRVMVMGDMKEASAEAGVEEIIKFSKANGWTVLDTLEYQTMTTDFSPIVIKTRGANPDAVLSTGLLPPILKLVKEMASQGVSLPHFTNAMVWPGPTPAIVGADGKNLTTSAFATNEEVPGNDRHNKFVAKFVERLKGEAGIPFPANASNSTLHYDTVFILADIMRKKGIDGNTPVEKARTLIKDGLAEVKGYDGVTKLTVGADRNGYIRAHLAKVDPESKMWKYVLPPDQRGK